jgi:hypothetical protein
VIKLRGVNFALGRTTAFSTHATNTTDASYLCRPGNPSRIRPHRASDCGHAYVRATSARLFGSPCWQSDRRNLATRKETAPGARPEAAPYGLRSPQRYRETANRYSLAWHVLVSAFHTPPAFWQSAWVFAAVTSPAKAVPVKARARTMAQMEIQVFMAFSFYA